MGSQASNQSPWYAMVPLSGPAAVGSALRAIRLSNGLTQAETAEAAGASRKWVSDAERGKPSMDVGLVIAVLKAMNYWCVFHPKPEYRGKLAQRVPHSRHQVGVRVRDLRRSLGLTQFEAAEASGVSRSWLCSLERDWHKHSAELRLVLKVLDAVGCEMQFHPRSQDSLDLEAHLEAYRSRRLDP